MARCGGGSRCEWRVGRRVTSGQLTMRESGRRMVGTSGSGGGWVEVRGAWCARVGGRRRRRTEVWLKPNNRVSAGCRSRTDVRHQHPWRSYFCLSYRFSWAARLARGGQEACCSGSGLGLAFKNQQNGGCKPCGRHIWGCKYSGLDYCRD